MAAEGRTCDNSVWQPQPRQHQRDGIAFGDPKSFGQRFFLKRVVAKGVKESNQALKTCRRGQKWRH